jgi:glycosyltransferase involved in cell wall biosynthesis
MQSEYSIEVYGKGWERYEEVVPFYKGVVKYGKDLADIYNSATYALAPHSIYMLQQRTLEASACGCIPILYDIRDFVEETHYDEALEYFKTEKDLATILSQEAKKKEFSRLLEENSYKTFVKKMVALIQKDKV